MEHSFIDDIAVIDGDLEAQEASPDAELEPETTSAHETPDLQRAYQEAQERLAAQAHELNDLRNTVGDLGAVSRSAAEKAEADRFMAAVSDVYSQNPIIAMDLMVRRCREQILEEVESRLSASTALENSLTEALSDPSFADLQVFKDEIHELVRSKGFHPKEAAALINALRRKHELSSVKLASAASDVRNKSATESDGDVITPRDPQKDFNRIVKKAKNLDEMFLGLRKAGLF